MARRVFFSFHYDDVSSFRANVVRNHGYMKGNQEAGFFDASIWGNANLKGDNAVKNVIEDGLRNTSVTCVLIGSKTWSRRWVRYEILRSYERGNRLIGIHINSIPDKNRDTKPLGTNPFLRLGFWVDAEGIVNHYQQSDGMKWSNFPDLSPTLSKFDVGARNRGFNMVWASTYDWVADSGYNNFGKWIEDLF